MTTSYTHALFFAILLMFCGCIAPMYAQSMQYENQEIEKIDVVVENLPPGANFDTHAVLHRIKTRAGDMFSHLDFDNDLKTLAVDFDRVIPHLESMNGKLYIALHIWPKPTIRSIKYTGNASIKDMRLQKELAIPCASIFDRQSFNKAFHKLKAYYVKKGFFEAELDYKIELDPLCNEVDIEILIHEGRAGKIKNIIFCGFSPEEKDDLIDMIFTKKYNFLTSWLTNEGTYNEEAVQQDQFTILNYIQNLGYADARVKIEIKEAPQCNRILLFIHLERGPQYFFGDIALTGNTLFCMEEIEPFFDIYKGKPFSPDKIRDTIRNITNFYGKKGYIDAIVDFEPTEDCETHTYNIHCTVEEGEQFRVGLIKVFGNCSTQTRVILHETLLTPGEIFNIEKLQATEERLQNIGYFKNVNVYAVKSDGPCGLGGNYRDVHIEVEETNTGYFSASGGFSSAEKLFFGLNVTEKNFNYKGLSCCWSDGFRNLRGGGEYFHMNATFGTKSRKYELGWTKPYFMDTKWIVGFDLENSSTRYISHHYDIDANGLTLHAAYQSNSFLRVGYHYRIRDSHIDLKKRDKRERHIAQIKDKEKRKKEQKKFDEQEEGIRKLRQQAKHQGIVSAIGTTLYYDSTNNPTCPTEGFKSRLTGEIAGVGGYHSFLALGYLNSYYYPLHKRGVLKFRADCRFLIPYGKTRSKTIPLDERLFLGGDTFIRGYRQYRLGPQFTKDDPKGGTSLQFLSLEYDRKLFKRADGFLFFDAGALTEKTMNFGRLNMAVGYGVRLKVLDSIPAITLGMGYPLNPKKKSDVKKFFFQFGGHF